MGTSAVFRANSTFKTGFAKIKNKYKKQGGADGIHYPLHLLAFEHTYLKFYFSSSSSSKYRCSLPTRIKAFSAYSKPSFL